MRVYLDNCCFNRPFDNQNQIRIYLESQAKLLKNQGINNKDALHIACAIEGKCDYFLTTDDNIIKKLKDFDKIIVINPVNFVNLLE